MSTQYTIDEIKEVLICVDSVMFPAYNTIDSATYLGISDTTLRSKLKQSEIKKYTMPMKSGLYILRQDLDTLRKAHLVTE